MQEFINHEPLSVQGKRTIGVLAVHGFTGSPWSMRPVAEFFAERNYAVELVRLPGHGTLWEDMVNFSRHDWLAEVDAAYWRLRRAGHTVVVVGLSMGGMLAIRQSVRREVAGTILINPFVRNPTPLLGLARFFSRFVATTDGITSDIALPDVDEGGYTRVPLSSAGELHLLGKETRPQLPALKGPVLYFRSRQDHVVSDESHHFFQKQIQCTVQFIDLKRSYHVATLDYDAPVILENSLHFIHTLEADMKGHA